MTTSPEVGASRAAETAVSDPSWRNSGRMLANGLTFAYWILRLHRACDESGGRLLDNLTIALCICIGTGVPWLIAIQSENGARQLIGNSVFGLVGTAFAALVFDWISPTYSIIALITAGPVVALLTIAASQALKRTIVSKLLQPPH